MKIPLSSLFWRVAAGGLAFVASAVVAAERPVLLPPFLVEESTRAPWRYAEFPGFELLSHCDDGTTQKIVDLSRRLHRMLSELLPEELQLSFSLPKILILEDEVLQSRANQEMLKGVLRPGLGHSLRTREVKFLPNLRLADRDCMVLFFSLKRGSVDVRNLTLTPEYLEFILRSRRPLLPGWFITGFVSLYRDVRFEDGAVLLRPMAWVGSAHLDELKENARNSVALTSLSALFAGRSAEGGGAARRRQAQAEMFVRWGLSAGGPELRQAFGRFVARAAAIGESEALFQECFGFDYAAGEERVANYLATAVTTPVRLKVAVPRDKLALRNATRIEFARIKGEWERLAARHVKATSEKGAESYFDQARRTLRQGLEESELDGRLLTSLALCELDAGDPATAQRHLEKAARTGALRPRASMELAGLRLAALRGKTTGESAQLSPEQLASVLKPLFDARGKQPPMSEVFELICAAWRESATPPGREHLAVIDEGIHLFPTHTPLVLRAAELNARHGFLHAAEQLVNLGLRAGPAAPSHAELLALRRQLSAVATEARGAR